MPICDRYDWDMTFQQKLPLNQYKKKSLPPCRITNVHCVFTLHLANPTMDSSSRMVFYAFIIQKKIWMANFKQNNFQPFLINSFKYIFSLVDIILIYLLNVVKHMVTHVYSVFKYQGILRIWSKKKKFLLNIIHIELWKYKSR